MHASSLMVFAVGALSAMAQTATSTMYMTATVTIAHCNPTNTDCPLYTPTVSSGIVSSVPTPWSSWSVSQVSSTPLASSYPAWSVSPQSSVSTLRSAFSSAAPSVFAGFPAVPSNMTRPAPAATFSAVPSHTPPASTGGAGSLVAQSGLGLAVMGLGAILLA